MVFCCHSFLLGTLSFVHGALSIRHFFCSFCFKRFLAPWGGALITNDANLSSQAAARRGAQPRHVALACIAGAWEGSDILVQVSIWLAPQSRIRYLRSLPADCQVAVQRPMHLVLPCHGVFSQQSLVHLSPSCRGSTRHLGRFHPWSTSSVIGTTWCTGRLV